LRQLFEGGDRLCRPRLLGRKIGRGLVGSLALMVDIRHSRG
jgi:hypothetical protein